MVDIQEGGGYRIRDNGIYTVCLLADDNLGLGGLSSFFLLNIFYEKIAHNTRQDLLHIMHCNFV